MRDVLASAELACWNEVSDAAGGRSVFGIHVRIDGSRLHQVDGYTLSAELARQAFGEGNQS